MALAEMHHAINHMTMPDSLDRFTDAQQPIYASALDEIRQGAKRSHWMWFIFPQLAELGRSETAKFYGIRSREEAEAYLDHPILGTRYRQCVEALQDLPMSDPSIVFGNVDAMKLRSSLTLFGAVRPSPLLAAALTRWFGEPDPLTLQLLDRESWP